MRISVVIISVVLWAMASLAVAKTGVIRYVGIAQITSHVVVIDTRKQSQCMQRSLAGAHCLPATDLLGPTGALPNFADIYWALGTVGLDGSETVLIVGNNTGARNFVAGVLYLCGQARVEILKPRITQVLGAGKLHTGPGLPRAILRQRIYRADMRDNAMLLPRELQRLNKRNQQYRLIDADHLQKNVLKHADKPRLEKYFHGHHYIYVIYASSVRKAIMVFTRMLMIKNDTHIRIRLVPLARPFLSKIS